MSRGPDGGDSYFEGRETIRQEMVVDFLKSGSVYNLKKPNNK